ncbi:hypothetical protein ABZ354_19190 [Streptomyces sp. NPDC005925]|uniref:hypothetical protein n=1 Tax=Streptomyces sp. NPDC005925 TaxID=3157172 RepID=UPI00340617B8
MRSEDTPFEGGPMDGRVLPVLTGMTGHPPRTYRIPVPDPHGGPPTVLVYRRVPRDPSGRVGLTRRWKYAYDPEGADGGGPKWPWSKPAPRRETRPDAPPDATPGGKPEDTDG